MICLGCGSTVPDGSSFCSTCGRTIDAASPVTPAPIPQPPYSPPATSGKAIAALVFGCLFLLFPAALLAIVLGHISLSEIRHSAGRIKGRGIAITALVLGYSGVSFVPILIIAAIAIPNLLRARIAANESSAVYEVRRLVNAEITYATAHPGTGYTCSLSDLRNLVDEKLTSGEKSGYEFVISNCVADPGTESHSKFRVLAHPRSYNESGRRSFCSDESGVIKAEENVASQDCFENGQVLQ